MKRNVHFVVPAAQFRLLGARAPPGDGRDGIDGGGSSDACDSIAESSSSSSSSGSDPWRHLSTYTFGTGVAKHHFCATCGVVPFYQPRSNPDGFAVTVHCLEPGTVQSVDVRRFDGTNWEGWLENSGIQAFSKPTTSGSAATE
jgi:hypothetical protein